MVARPGAVYPRWRGEHISAVCLFFNPDGLSPLARGTPRRNFHFFVSFRFIPAGAGNTSRLISVWIPAPVYPRWRGEHYPLALRIGRYVGLSPLARGTLTHEHNKTGSVRFIPAGAGNTANVLLSVMPTAVYPRWRGEHLSPYPGSEFGAGLSPLARGTLSVDVVAFADFRFIPAGAGNTQPAWDPLS